MTDDESLKKVMQENGREMTSSFRSLMQKHGPDKVMFANSVVNGFKLGRLLRESGTPDSLITLVEVQFQMMLSRWGRARNYNYKDIEAIADGICGQEAILEQDLLDAVQQTADGGSPTKE